LTGWRASYAAPIAMPQSVWSTGTPQKRPSATRAAACTAERNGRELLASERRSGARSGSLIDQALRLWIHSGAQGVGETLEGAFASATCVRSNHEPERR